MQCDQIGCHTPAATGIKFRVWVYGEHYDHRTREAAERRIDRMSHYEREVAVITKAGG